MKKYSFGKNILAYLIVLLLSTTLNDANAYEPLPNLWYISEFESGYVEDGNGNYLEGGGIGGYVHSTITVTARRIHKFVSLEYVHDMKTAFNPMSKFVSELHHYDPDEDEWEFYEFNTGAWKSSRNWEYSLLNTANRVQPECIQSKAESALAYVDQNYSYGQAACNIGVQQLFGGIRILQS